LRRSTSLTTRSSPTTRSRHRPPSGRRTGPPAPRAQGNSRSGCRFEPGEDDMSSHIKATLILSCAVAALVGVVSAIGERSVVRAADAALPAGAFEIEEATIAGIQQALVGRRVTTAEIVGMYLARIKAYNGTCVNQPEGLL